MNSPLFLDLLLQFGFTRNEAETYHYLLKHGPKSVVALSKNLNTYREHAYRTLASLQDRGAVEFKLNEQGIYIAVPIEKALDMELRRHQIEYDEKKELVKTILEVKDEIHLEPLGTSCRFQLRHTLNDVAATCARMVESSVQHVMFILPPELSSPEMQTLVAAAISAAKRGLEVRAVMVPIEYPNSLAKYLKIRKYERYDGIPFLSVDSTETMTLICWTKSGGLRYRHVSAFYCDDPTYAEHLEFIFRMVWNRCAHTKTAEKLKTV
jgi:sugar-specific transcriptional regulator TrmB